MIYIFIMRKINNTNLHRNECTVKRYLSQSIQNIYIRNSNKWAILQKNFDILAISLNVLHNYFDRSNKIDLFAFALFCTQHFYFLFLQSPNIYFSLSAFLKILSNTNRSLFIFSFILQILSISAKSVFFSWYKIYYKVIIIFDLFRCLFNRRASLLENNIPNE